jgi:hypothetical protein
MVGYNLLDELPLLPLAKAARQHPAFSGKNPATIVRWAKRGIKRHGQTIRLESIRIGSSLCTSQPALDRFLTALNEADETQPVPRSPAQRNKASERAAAELDKKFAAV